MSISHIKSIGYADESWCGEKLGTEYYFKSIEQAVINQIHPNKIENCIKCIQEVIKRLEINLKNYNT